jgi:acetylornithine deacetylase/succinyl-diaminopimelate desuccinylase-like protein
MLYGVDAVFRYIDEHLARSLDDVCDYVRLPSVSAEGRAIDETLRFTVALLEREGFETRVLPKRPGGLPVVFAEHKGATDRTLLFYNHYDVQPADPLDEWTTGPFEPVVRDGKLFGRGTSDNKGNIVSRLLAIRALKEAGGGLPCHVKFFIEGDEEIGSPQIGPLIEEHRDLLRADACIWEWGYVLWDGTPTLMLGVKGLLYVDLEVEGPAHDVHSSQATVIPNPAWRLIWALASLKGPDERVLIDGFYDDVRPPSEEERAAVLAMPDDAAETLASLGLRRALLGLEGAAFRARHIFEPTCTVAGLAAGYQGPGTKTVLPARASAKLEFRLVVDQDPLDILTKLRKHLDRHGFEDVKVVAHSREKAARTRIDDPFVRLCRETAPVAYDREAIVVPNMAATGPMHYFVDVLGLPSVMTGVNYAGSRDHAPDEHIRIDDYRRGTRHVAAVLLRLGEEGL